MNGTAPTLSLAGVASYLPEAVVENSFFSQDAPGNGGGVDVMFLGARQRRHVENDVTGADMIMRAALKLVSRLGIRPERDIDIIMTNVSVPDQFFNGCGVEVSHRLGCKPGIVLDLHNGGCVCFLLMMQIARSLMWSYGARSALLCVVQNCAGRIARHPLNRTRPEAAIPGDGCGVGYCVAGGDSPIRSLVWQNHGEYARDMLLTSEDGKSWWEPRTTPVRLDFNRKVTSSIIKRAVLLVPAIVRHALDEARITVADLDLFITNQPNALLLRQWRKDLGIPAEKHVDTFEEHGNLFGAAIPINLERALERGMVRKGGYVALGGFAHAGDCSGGAVMQW